MSSSGLSGSLRSQHGIKFAWGAISKAMKGLVGGSATGDKEQRESWANALIPKAVQAHMAIATQQENNQVLLGVYGAGGGFGESLSR
eukprot:2457702-Amphidinium_carterae.1